MNSNLSQLYSRNNNNFDLYLSSDSEIFYYITDYDKYKLSGKNIIIGAVEVILTKLLNMSVARLETVLIKETKNLKKIQIDTFLNALNTHSFIINTIKIIAKKNYLINQIINKNLELFPENQNNKKPLCIEYYKIIYFLKGEHERYRYPWLKTFIDKYETSIIYKQGQIYYKENLNRKFNLENNTSQTITFPKDSIIYQNGDNANYIYFLKSGTVDIFTGEERIVTVNKPGTILGIIESFIKTKRIHTIKTKNEVTIQQIPVKTLFNQENKNINLLKQIISNMAYNYFLNIKKLHQINEKVIKQNFDTNLAIKKQKIFNQGEKTTKELKSLKQAILELLTKNNSEIIKQKYEELFSNPI